MEGAAKAAEGGRERGGWKVFLARIQVWRLGVQEWTGPAGRRRVFPLWERALSPALSFFQPSFPPPRLTAQEFMKLHKHWQDKPLRQPALPPGRPKCRLQGAKRVKG